MAFFVAADGEALSPFEMKLHVVDDLHGGILVHAVHPQVAEHFLHLESLCRNKARQGLLIEICFWRSVFHAAKVALSNIRWTCTDPVGITPYPPFARAQSPPDP